MAGRSRARRFKLLGAFILLAVVAWSMLWFIAATVVDRQIDKAEKLALSNDATLLCVNRSVTGFPFRIEVRCGEARAGGPAGLATLSGLTAVAQIYDPTRLIAEAQGPLEVAGALGIHAQWSLAHASAELSFRDRTARQIVAEVKGLELSLGSADLAVGQVFASIRRDPATPADLDVFARLADLVPLPDAAASTLSLNATVPGGAAVLGGRPEAVVDALAASGLPLSIKALTFHCGDMEVVATGNLTLAPDGLVNGTVDVAIAGWDGGLPYLPAVAPAAAASLRAMMANVLPYAPETTIGKRTAKKIALVVRDGQVRAGVFPVMKLPRVALAGG